MFLIKNKVKGLVIVCKIFQIAKSNYDRSQALNLETSTDIQDIFKDKMKEKHLNILQSFDAY